MTGLTAPPSPRSRVCRLRTSSAVAVAGSRLTRRTRTVSPSTSARAPRSPGTPGVEAPRANLALDLVRRSRPIDPRVLGLEEVEVARHALVLRVAGIALRDPLEDARAACSPPPSRELRRELLPTVLVTERDRHLTEDVPRVELGVHVVEGEADLALPVADRPRDGARAAVARKERRVPVDDAVPRSRERVRRDLPREPDAERDVRLEVPQERSDATARRRHDDVELRRSRLDELIELRVALRIAPNAEQRDRLVPLRPQHRRETLDRRRDLRDEDDSHPRSNSRIRSQSVTTLSNSACSVCA